MPVSDTVIVTDGDNDTEGAVEEAVEEVEEAADDIADAVEDAVMDGTTIQLVERVTRVEDALVVQASAIEQLQGEIAGLRMSDEAQQNQINNVETEVVEVATEAADAIETVVDEVEEASPEIEPDEVPAQREHIFFRKWGRR
jgi:predicted  nucleic acid-binding Zn-ribbon protein